MPAATAKVESKPSVSKPKPKSEAPKPAPAKAGKAPALPAFARSALASPGESVASGAPMSPHVQQAIENSLGVDMGSVRVHNDAASQDTARALSARAFTFGSNIVLGPGERPNDVGLMAHEAAHVVQQQSAPAVQTWSADRGDRFEQEADRASSAVQRGESFTVRERVGAPKVQRLGISDALDYFADKAYNIPGYRMFTILIGVNPINMEHVERSPANILRAVVEFLPGGHLITEALDKYGVFDKAGNWISEQLDKLSITGASIRNALMDFLDSLSWRDIFHLGRVWDRAVAIFSDPIHRILDFLGGLVEGIWHFIRDAILKPLAKLAEGTSGWDLLCAVLGRNPITGEAVPRTPETLIGGFMKLIHQEEIWENIKKANAIARAFAWFQTALAGLIHLVTQIPSLFIDALKSLEWTDVINLPSGFMKIARVFGKFLGDFISWAGNTIWDLLQIIFEVVAPGAMPYLKKLGGAFKSILKNPIGFVRNLVSAGKLGFQMFVGNIGTHLKASLLDWLTGSIPGVYIPKALDLKEIVKFVLSVLGLTWENIRGKLVKVVGETAVKAMETGFDIVVTLVRDGPAAAWEVIQKELSNLKDTVMNAIMSFVVETIVKKAVAKVLSLLVPGGAFIQAIISIYDTIMVFVDKLAKIFQVVKAFLDSLMQIVSGAIGAAAQKVENTLAGILTLAINFLAGFLGLGKIADKIREVIVKIRTPIDKAMDKVIDWIVTMAKKGFAKIFGGKEQAKDPKAVTDPKEAARQAVHSQLAAGASIETVEAGLHNILHELQPMGLKSLELGPPNAEDEREILAEASPKSRVGKLVHKRVTVAIVATVTVKGEEVLSGILRGPTVERQRSGAETVWPGESMRFSDFHESQKDALGSSGRAALLPGVPQPPRTAARKGSQPSAGVIVEPEKGSRTLEVLGWNTSQPEKGHNTSHAERQFIEWFEDRPRKWLARVVSVHVEVQGRPVCPICEGDLKRLRSRYSHIDFSWTGSTAKDKEALEVV